MKWNILPPCLNPLRDKGEEGEVGLTLARPCGLASGLLCDAALIIHRRRDNPTRRSLLIVKGWKEKPGKRSGTALLSSHIVTVKKEKKH